MKEELKMRVFNLFLSFTVALSLVIGMNTKHIFAAPDKSIQVSVGGSLVKLSAVPRMEKGTTMVPLRDVAEALGAKVTWTPLTNGKSKIVLTRVGKSATLTVGSKSMQTMKGKSVTLDVAPYVRNGVTLVPLRAVSELLGAVVAWDSVGRIVRINEPTQLPVIGSEQRLVEILKKSDQTLGLIQPRVSMMLKNAAAGQAMAESAPQAVTSDAAASSGDFSQTNVQVEGVDEADWAKTDGKYIYQISQSRLQVVDIANPKAPKLMATINFATDEGYYPQEMYTDGTRLIVIGQDQLLWPAVTPKPAQSSSNPQGKMSAAMASDARMAIWPNPYRSTVKTIVYDLSTVSKPKKVREMELEGNYISSRKIGGAVYIVTNKYNNIYPIIQGDKASTESAMAEFKPVYSDTAGSGKVQQLSLGQLRYFPNSPDTSTLMIGAFDLNKPEKPMQVSAYLGSGQTIYASLNHLYIAVGKYTFMGEQTKQETQIYKFGLDQGTVTYKGEGLVPGTILNQFSLDEHDGAFRIATTSGNMWATGEATSKNNLYVLDDQLKRVGSLEGLAPGERIYSVRFMGNRAYMVTFRNVDPLFVIDLKNVTQPKVLGELKIPGYSDYLHPYDENHIIGFGKETIELPSKGWGPDETMAFYQGLKIAMFDVSNVSKPKEKFKEIIGDRGTNSELLYNHKALLFSKEKNLMAFPVELMEIPNKTEIVKEGMPTYGQFKFQGAYIYGIDLKKGFQLRGQITHLSKDDLTKAGMYGYDYSKTVRRILYAGNTLYTLSDHMLKANDFSTLNPVGSLEYPGTK
jgi:inhibitor of cysteine peptidase